MVLFSPRKKMGGKFGKNSMSHKKIHPTRAMMMEDDDDDDDDFYVRYYVVRHVFRSRGGGFFKNDFRSPRGCLRFWSRRHGG